MKLPHTSVNWHLRTVSILKQLRPRRFRETASCKRCPVGKKWGTHGSQEPLDLDLMQHHFRGYLHGDGPNDASPSRSRPERGSQLGLRRRMARFRPRGPSPRSRPPPPRTRPSGARQSDSLNGPKSSKPSTLGFSALREGHATLKSWRDAICPISVCVVAPVASA